MVAYLALFVALGGTGAWAADKVTSKKIARNAVRSAHIGKNAVRSKHIKAGNVKRSDLAARAVNSAKVADASLTGADIAGGAVDSTKVADNSLTGVDIAEGALGQVPSAASADTALDADLLDGKSGADVVRWARVGSDGSLGPAFGLTSTRLPATNTFVVTASEPIERCAAIASPTAFVGQTSTYPGAAGSTPDPNSVTVLTQDSAGDPVAAGFSIAVLC